MKIIYTDNFNGDYPDEKFVTELPRLNQEQADKRIPILLQIPAAKRFVSIEPMLGPVDITKYLISGADGFPEEIEKHHDWLDQIIVGGESGPGSRPIKEEWVTNIRDQCVNSNIPFFFKQWGGVNKKKAGRLLENRTWDELPYQYKPAS